MRQTFEEYLEDVAKNGELFSGIKPLPNKNVFKTKLGGPNGKYIFFKKSMSLNYFSSDDISIIYIKDDTENNKLTNDLNNKNFTLHLSHSILYIDFDTDYYYTLHEFETFEQFNYILNNNKITIGLLNKNKSDIINKWTKNVNLL